LRAFAPALQRFLGALAVFGMMGAVGSVELRPELLKGGAAQNPLPWQATSGQPRFGSDGNSG
jgi:hypothetical protein